MIVTVRLLALVVTIATGLLGTYVAEGNAQSPVLGGSPSPGLSLASGGVLWAGNPAPVMLRPVAVATPTPTVTPPPSSTPAGRVLSGVLLTYYTDRGNMASGPWVFPGAASVDPRVLPHGTLFRVVGDDVIRVALDTGGLVVGRHTDLWMPSMETGRAFLRRFGTEVEIEILQEVK